MEVLQMILDLITLRLLTEILWSSAIWIHWAGNRVGVDTEEGNKKMLNTGAKV
jgi:hypothetical protein